jgi:WD40 repeat protein
LELKDGRVLYGCNYGIIGVLTLDGEQIKTIGEPQEFEAVNSMIELKNGNVVAAGILCYVPNVIIWDIDEETRLRSLYVHCRPRSLCALRNGGFVINERNTIIMFDDDGAYLRTFTGHSAEVNCIIQLQNGDLVSGSSDKTIKIWNISGCLQTLRRHSNSITGLLELRDGMLVSGDGKTINIWSAVIKIQRNILFDVEFNFL